MVEELFSKFILWCNINDQFRVDNDSSKYEYPGILSNKRMVFSGNNQSLFPMLISKLQVFPYDILLDKKLALFFGLTFVQEHG